MRKSLFFMAIFICTNMFSQVLYDKYYEDGSRIIQSYEKLFGMNRNAVIHYGLSDYITPEGIDNFEFYFNFGLHFERAISKGNKLLIKFEDNTIIELESKDYITSKSANTTDVRYNVKEEDLKKMMTVKVVKIRIENDADYDDFNVKPKRFAKDLTSFYDNIQKVRKKSKKDIYDGF